MKKKQALLPFAMITLVAALGCKQLTGDNTTPIKEPPPGATKGNASKTFSLEGKQWSNYELSEMDASVDLPGKPVDKTPPMPPSYKAYFSAMHIHAYDDNDFGSSVSELVPTGKKKWNMKELADTPMLAMKKQLPDLNYTSNVRSETNITYTGTFTKNGKPFEVRGCCVYKKDNPSRVWAVLTYYAKDNADGQTASQRIIESVVFKNSTEQCK